MNIYIASDHAGFKLKEELKSRLHGKYDFTDLGTYSEDSVDYPDYADLLAKNLRDKVGFGVLICGSGIGITIAANRFSFIRAALCRDEEDARLSREHNNANVIVFPGRKIETELAARMMVAFMETNFSGGRHIMRVNKLSSSNGFFSTPLSVADREVFKSITDEMSRQKEGIELIASENIVSQAVLEAQGSIMTNKYAEGYPGKRYYGGCEFVDEAERLAIERAKKLFEADFVNVQPHSGSQANQAVYLALLNPGDSILGMALDSGGHLTHGAKVNISGKWFNAHSYTINERTGLIDMEMVEKAAKECKPKLIIAGGSAYPREIDFAGFRKIADQTGALLMVDMAHFAGLVAGGCFPSPIKHAHVVTTTTHKTLRGPRGGMILTNDEEIMKKINSAVFPGIQGGPLMHVIAAKAVAFGEALQPDFKQYAKDVISNARELAKTLQKRGYTIFTGGTDCHLMLVDLRPQGLTGKDAEASLGRAGLTCNKNSIPFDTEKPFITSGIRLGSPATTTRGFKADEFRQVGEMIADVLDSLRENRENNQVVEDEVHKKVLALCHKFPIY